MFVAHTCLCIRNEFQFYEERSKLFSSSRENRIRLSENKQFVSSCKCLILYFVRDNLIITRIYGKVSVYQTTNKLECRLILLIKFSITLYACFSIAIIEEGLSSGAIRFTNRILTNWGRIISFSKDQANNVLKTKQNVVA